MAKLYLGETEITPIMEVATGGELIVYPQTELEINKNGYYATHSSKNITTYNNWNYTSIVDISDVDYIALNKMSTLQYSYYLKNYTAINYFVIINNEAFRVYNVMGTNEIGFSGQASDINSLKMYKIKENNIALPKVIVEE